MTLTDIFNAIIAALMLPFQAILLPLDLFLKNIPGLSVIPDTIVSVVGIIGTIPSFLVSISGINPIIWNALFLTFLLYMSAGPTVQFIKKIWSWVRL